MSCVIVAGSWTIPAAELSAGSVEDKIAALVATSGNGDGSSGTQTALDAAVVIPRLYQQRDYRPAWFGTRAVDELFQALNNGIAQGFQPSDFHLPQLMDLHDAFDSKALVIIAVHNASVASIEEMEAKLQKARQTYWKGRDLPFLVALDGSDPAIEGAERPSEGATTAAYGIRSYPTTILIDREGNVVGEMNLFRGKEILQQILDAEPKR